MEAAGVRPQGAISGPSMHGKAWDACQGKGGTDKGVQLQSPSKGTCSLWSTQDGFAPSCTDPDRDSSIECVQDIGSLRWGSEQQPTVQPRRQWGDQDCFATCTSRDAEAPVEQKQRAAHVSGNDAAAVPDTNHRRNHDGGWGHGARGRAPADGAGVPAAAAAAAAAAAPTHSHMQAAPAVQQHQEAAPASAQSKAEQLRQWSCQQLEDLLAMIRNEQTLEQELCAKAGLLEQQEPSADAITPQMVMIVSSWLSEVAYEFSMQQETLFLAVALLGRFLEASTGVPRGVLQLVAVACMMLAAKQDEVVHPSVQELTDIAANCFSVQDLLRMERILLDSLAWRVKTPTAYTFLHLFTQSTAAMRAAGGPAPQPAEPLSGMVVAKAAFLTELALLDPAMLTFAPSQVAGSALLLAQSWSPQGAAAEEMRAISGYGPGQLQQCMARLTHLHHCAGLSDTCESLAPFAFIRDKYAQDCWLQASMAPAPASAPAMGALAGSPAAAGGGSQQAGGVLPEGDGGAGPMEA